MYPNREIWGILAKIWTKRLAPGLESLNNTQKLLENVWGQKPRDFECGELGYEFSVTLKIPKIPRISSVLSRCKKMEERRVRLLMLILNFVPLTTIGPFYWCDCKQILSDSLQEEQ